MDDRLESQRRTLRYLIIANFLLYFGFRIWQTMINNFAVEEMGVSPGSIGWIQALREVPGLMGFLTGFLVLYLSEIRIMALSVILLGTGLFLTGQAYNLSFLLVSTIVMSCGFHFFNPSNAAIVLMVIDKDEAPKTLGWLRSLGSFSALAGTVVVYFLAARWDYRTMFMTMGGLIVLGGLLLLPLGDSRDGTPLRRQIKFRREYWLYYLLAFLMGSRRHIFTTFAIFLLVREYGVDVQTTAILFLVNSMVNVICLPLVGRLVGQLGERIMLSVAFGILFFVFIGYALMTSLYVLFVLFVFDNIMFNFNLAMTTYFQKIAVTQEEITSNVAMQQTINHIAAIIMPVMGGVAWELFGSKTPFLVGAGIVVISLLLVQFLRVPAQSTTEAESALTTS